MKNKEIYEWEKELSFDADSFDLFDESILPQVKQIMQAKLTPTEMRILTIYCNAGSTRKAAAYSNIGYRMIAVVVKGALQKIRKELNRIEKKNKRIIV